MSANPQAFDIEEAKVEAGARVLASRQASRRLLYSALALCAVGLLVLASWAFFGKSGATAGSAIHLGEGSVVVASSNMFGDGAEGTERTHDSLCEVVSQHPGSAVWIKDGRAGNGSVSYLGDNITMEFLRNYTWKYDGVNMQQLILCGLQEHTGVYMSFYAEGEPCRVEPDLRHDGPSVGHAAPVEAVFEAIDKASTVIFAGGDPYRFISQFRSPAGKRIFEHIRKRLERGHLLLIGRSAGTIVTGSDVHVSAEFPVTPTGGDFTGLDLFGGLIPRPHYDGSKAHSAEWRSAHAEEEWNHEDYFANLPVPRDDVVPLPDGNYLLYEAGTLRVSGPHGTVAEWSVESPPPPEAVYPKQEARPGITADLYMHMV